MKLPAGFLAMTAFAASAIDSLSHSYRLMYELALDSTRDQSIIAAPPARFCTRSSTLACGKLGRFID
jgi:hypothetical protein